MYSLQKIKENRYVSLIFILTLCYILGNTSFYFLSGINFSIIIYIFIAYDIDEKTYIPYSIILGLYSDYILSSFIGLGVLFFLSLSMLKMFSEYKFDSNSMVSVISLSIFSIISYNLFAAIVTGYNLILSFLYILQSCFFDFIVFIIIFLIMEFYRAFRSIER